MMTQGVLKATEGLTSWVLPGRVDKAERTVQRVMWQVQETDCGSKERPGIWVDMVVGAIVQIH